MENSPSRHKKRRPAMGRPRRILIPNSKFLIASRGGASGLAHAFGDDADLLDAGALGGVDHVDDVAVAQRAGRDDEHRLVLALVEDVAQPRLELGQRHVLLVDGQTLVGGVIDHDLADVGRDVGGLLALRRQVDVDALLRERQGGHEDDDQHEQHVDERRDVHVRTGVRHFSGDDLVGAEVMVCVRHYLPPVGPSAVFFGSAIRPMSSMPAWRSWSIAAITALYSTSSSALMRTTFSLAFSRSSPIFVASSASCTGLAFTYIDLSLAIAITVWPSTSGLSPVLVACGSLTLTPCCSSGATIIMMMSSTSMTSQSGVTLISDLTPPLAPPTSIAINRLSYSITEG